MHVHSSTQHPTEVQHIVAHMLGIARRHGDGARCRRMGGGFGGKESQAAQWACLARAGRARHRPALPRCRLDRDDDMIMTGKRHDFRVDYDVGLRRRRPRSRPSTSTSPRAAATRPTCRHGVSTAPCSMPTTPISTRPCASSSRRLKTNTVSNTAFRGFGGPQGMVCRRARDGRHRHAHRPRSARRAQGQFLRRRGRDVTPYGMQVEDNIAARARRRARSAPRDYRARREADRAPSTPTSRVLKKGIALTPVKFGISFTLTHLNQAGALVHVYTDGSVQLNHGGTEMGQGLYHQGGAGGGRGVRHRRSTGCGSPRPPPARCPTPRRPRPPPAPTSTAWRRKAAAATIRDRLADFAAKHWQVPKRRSRASDDGQVLVGNRAHGLRASWRGRPTSRASRCPATGYYATPEDRLGPRQGQGPAVLLFRLWRGLLAKSTIDT